jgi:hypothetical protein
MAENECKMKISWGEYAVLVFCLSSTSFGQTLTEPAIEDNSFLIEEAYNQEERVVQHISNLSILTPRAGSAQFSFTQEWPLFSHEHQFSYTLNYEGSGGSGAFGDFYLNYRYQLFDSEAWAAIAPRISVILRTGSGISSSGTRRPGWQFNLPLSKRVFNDLALHLNAGMEIDPGFSSSNPDGTAEDRTLTQKSVGFSVIWLAKQHLNFLCEFLLTSNQEKGDDGQVTQSTQCIFNPGVRASVDIGSLQIVPGLGVPVRVTGDMTTAGVFFYLSFEHPF